MGGTPKDLEALWRRNRRERGSARGSIVEVPADLADMGSLYRGLERPEGLRGKDFVQELASLALEWGDQRFAQCFRALFELGIVDKQSHIFTKKRGPHATSLKASAMDYAVAKVWALRDRNPNLSEWEACALIAEELVWEAASFEAAIEQLRQASRRARKGPEGLMAYVAQVIDGQLNGLNASALKVANPILAVDQGK